MNVFGDFVRGLWWFKGCKLVLILEVNFYFKKYFDINEKGARVIYTIH